MIVPMEKVTVLCVASDRDATLEALGRLGVVHITHTVAPEGEDVERARAALTRIERVMELVPHRAGRAPSGQAAEQVVEDVDRLLRSMNETTEKLRGLREEHLTYEPFGSFEPDDAVFLGQHGLPVHLYKASAGHAVPSAEGAQVVTLRRNRTGTWYATVGSGTPADPEATSVPLPGRSVRAMEQEIARHEAALRDGEEQLARFSGDLPRLEELAEVMRGEVRFLEARRGMGARSPVSYLRGYYPVRHREELRDLAAQRGWGLHFEPLKPGETAPTLLENSWWVRPIKAVLDFIGVLPGYWEVDISAFFLIFLTLFFAVIVGDAGYGALFLAFTLLGRVLAPGVMKKPVFPLLLIMSVATIVWGALTGAYFGIAVESLPAPLRALRREWLTIDKNMMQLCFLCGAVHLTLAHGWALLRNRTNLTALSHVGWILSTWTMYAVANQMVLDRPMPGFVKPAFAVGVVLIALFMTPWRAMKTEWMGHAMLPLTLISNFVDVVSYVRLFAVGTATLAVAGAFNEMAAGFGWSGIVNGAVAAFILFFGHSLNILLAAMGVLVHGVRLNTLEFSGHLGLTWSGVPYVPFARKGGRSS